MPSHLATLGRFIDCPLLCSPDPASTVSSSEHLDIFCELKNVARGVKKRMISGLLKRVALTKVANRQAGTYSGGMKRRLSLAIAACGNPKCIILGRSRCRVRG